MKTILNDVRSLIQTSTDTICISGGATGADSLWSQLAWKYASTETIHYSFENHNAYCPLAKGIRVIVPTEQLLLADHSLHLANKSIKRKFPSKSIHVNNLLRRNYYQVLDSTACYAVSRIKCGVVDGGTSWATQMFIDRHMMLTPHDACPCYVYDTITDKWYQWKQTMWCNIESLDVPTPSGIWTGIGSRDLTSTAITAMHELWTRHHIKRT